MEIPFSFCIGNEVKTKEGNTGNIERIQATVLSGRLTSQLREEFYVGVQWYPPNSLQLMSHNKKSKS